MSNQEIILQAEKAIREQRFDVATQYMQQAVSENPNDLELIHNLAALYVKTQNVELAQTLLEEKTQVFKECSFLLKQLANIYQHKKEYEKARHVYQKAIDVNSNDASAYNNLGLVYLEQANWSEAIAAFKKALSIESDYQAAMYNLALCYYRMSDREQCTSCLLGLLSANPNHPNAVTLMIKLLLSSNLLQDALKYCDRLLNQFPGNAVILNNIIRILFEFNQFESAENYLKQLIDIDENDYVALYNMGYIAQREGDYQKAINFFEKTLLVAPDYFPAINNLAIIYLEKRETEKARIYLQKALVLNPGRADLKHRLDVLDNKPIETTPKAYIKELFDYYAQHFDMHLTQGLDYQIPQLLRSMVNPFLPKQKRLSILDLGCGTGLTAQAFADLDANQLGVDLSERMLDVAKSKNIYKELFCNDVVSFLDNTHETFDVMLAGDVLVYFGGLKELFDKIYVHLNVSGVFAFSVEAIAGDSYQISPSGRFTHSLNYIEQAASQSSFDVLATKHCMTRQQYGEPVHGLIVVLRKL